MNILFITIDAYLYVWPQYACKGQRRTWGWFFHFTRDETQVLRFTKQALFPVEPFHQSANMFLLLYEEFLFNIQYWKKKNWLHLYDNLEIFSQICFSKCSKVVQAGIIIPIQTLRPRIEGSKWNDVCSLVWIKQHIAKVNKSINTHASLNTILRQRKTLRHKN